MKNKKIVLKTLIKPDKIAFMNAKKSQINILLELTDELPSFAGDYLMTRTGERTLGTRINYARNFKVFLQYLIDVHPEYSKKKTKDIGISELKEVSPVEIDTFLTIYAEDHKESATANVKTAISVMYKYLCDTLQVIEKNPVSGAQKIRIPEKNYVIYLNEEEQEKLLNTIRYGTGLSKKQLTYHKYNEKRDLAIVFLFLDTGLRVSELCSLCIQDTDLEGHYLIVKRKRGYISKVFFSDEATEYISDYLKERQTLKPMVSRPEDPLFLSLRNESISVREVQTLVQKYVSTALPDKNQKISCHKLRSSFAMSFYQSTMDVLLLKERMNHKSLTTTQKYVTALQEDVKKTRNWR